MSFKRATKHEAWLRMALAGIAGTGKTWTGLTIATAIAKGGPIALIDTEHGSASKYADLFTFDVLELSNFHPQNYINAIREAVEAHYSVLIIDSLSHAWNGTGGALELVETTARKVAAQRKKEPNSFNAWGDVTPLQNKLIDTILASPIHIIATLRTKTEYVVEKDKDGKSVPRKVGMAPIQRADVEYEFDLYAEMDTDNTLIVQKSRCPALSGQVIAKPDHHLATTIGTWLAGEPVPEPVEGATTPPETETSRREREQLNALYQRAKRLGLCATGKEFVTYIGQFLRLSTLDVSQITLTMLYFVEEELCSQEREQSISVGEQATQEVGVE